MSRLQKYFHKVAEEKRDSAAIAFLASLDHIYKHDPQIADAILQELKDQRSHLKLIASENFSSLAVQLSMGNLLTDKYAEGFPFHRFYAGCSNVDAIESSAVAEAKNVFGAEHAYVQPHSGADANMVAFWSILVQRVQNREVQQLGKKGLAELTEQEYERIRQLLFSQKMMGLSLNSGGHLTHGYLFNCSSKLFQSVPYEVERETEELDYAKLQKQVLQEKPLVLIGGYSAYPRKINFAKMREIADSVGAVLMVDMAHFAGLVAGKVFQGEYNPVPYADIVTSTTHKTLRGPRGGLILCKESFREVIDKGCPLVLGGPLPHVLAAKAIAFKEAGSVEFQRYAHQIVANSRALAEELLQRGVRLTTRGTDNHLLVLDVADSFGLTGKQAESALREAFMTVNRNAIPFDKNGPWFASGVRIGTPALTTLGMQEKEMQRVGSLMHSLLSATTPSAAGERTEYCIEQQVLHQVRSEVQELLQDFPLYPEVVI